MVFVDDVFAMSWKRLTYGILRSVFSDVSVYVPQLFHGETARTRVSVPTLWLKLEHIKIVTDPFVSRLYVSLRHHR